MSLLLQALKRAEETKRQRENSATEPVTVPAGNTPEVMEDISFPTLEEPTIAPVQSAVVTERIEPVLRPTEADLTPSMHDPANPEPASVTSTSNMITLEFEPAPPAPLPVESPVSIAKVAESPAPSAASPAPKVPESAPAMAPLADPAAPSAARQLLSAPRAKSARSTLPWLVLGGCILLGGMGAWFWWQIQQINLPTQPVALGSTPAPDASAPAATADKASEPDVLIPTGMINASAVVARPSIKAPAASAVALKPSTVSRPLGSDAANYIENVPAPAPFPPIERRTQEAAVPAPLEAAWQAYQKGDLAAAEAQYQRMLSIDSRNRDAHLGLAAIAAQRGKKNEATAWYKKLLTMNPQDEDAQAGLTAVDTDALSERTEARLLQQSDRPESPLVLGQFYAARNRWHEAQEQYFIAFARDAGNADLAFNLAISLDHLNQPKLAADYYRKALTLGRSSFDRKATEKRLAEIVAGQK